MTKQLDRPGWYPDPAGLPTQRWWDGSEWTEQLAPLTASGIAVATEPTSTSSHKRVVLLGVGLGVGIAAVAGAIVAAVLVVTGGSDTKDDPANGRAQSDLRNTVTSIESCITDNANEMPNASSESGTAGDPVVLDCSGSSMPLALSGDDVMQLTFYSDHYIVSVGSTSATKIFTYDSATGKSISTDRSTS